MDNNRTNEGLGGSSAEIPTVEGLKKLRMELEQRMLVSSKKVEGDIKKKLVDREVLIAEEAENEVLFDRAVETLAYFDGLKKQELLTAEEDIQALIDLEKTIISLDEQRKGISAKHDSIMSIPEVEGAVMDEALAEDKNRSDKINKAEKTRNLNEKAVEFVKKVDQLESDVVEYDKKGTEFSALIGGLEKTIDSIKDHESKIFLMSLTNGFFNTQGMKTVAWVWGEKYRLKPKIATTFIKKVSEYKKGLGFFDIKKKMALSPVLSKESECIEADKKQEEFEKIQKSLFEKFDELYKQFQELGKEGYRYGGNDSKGIIFRHDDGDRVENAKPEVRNILQMFYDKNRY